MFYPKRHQQEGSVCAVRSTPHLRNRVKNRLKQLLLTVKFHKKSHFFGYGTNFFTFSNSVFNMQFFQTVVNSINRFAKFYGYNCSITSVKKTSQKKQNTEKLARPYDIAYD